MSAIDTVAKTAARDMFKALGQEVIYQGANGEIATWALIDRQVDLFAAESAMADNKYTCSLLVEDVVTPERGDRVTDEDGTLWLLRDLLPTSDRWITEWSVTQR